MADDTARYEYPDVRSVGETYRPAAVGRRRSDGEWEGRIEFVAETGVKRVSTDVETTQPDAEAFRYWANGIGVAYLEGALARETYAVDGKLEKWVRAARPAPEDSALR